MSIPRIEATDVPAPHADPTIDDARPFSLRIVKDSYLSKYELEVQSSTTIAISGNQTSFYFPFEPRSRVVFEITDILDKTQLDITFTRPSQIQPYTITEVIDELVRPFLGTVYELLSQRVPELRALRVKNVYKNYDLRGYDNWL